MKFLVLLVIAFVYVALAQQQESSNDPSTPATPLALEEQPPKPLGKPSVLLFPQVLPEFNRLFVPFRPDADVEFEQAQSPLEYQFNDRFSVEPYFTFPPNVGGGLNFRYRF